MQTFFWYKNEDLDWKGIDIHGPQVFPKGKNILILSEETKKRSLGLGLSKHYKVLGIKEQ